MKTPSSISVAATLLSVTLILYGMSLGQSLLLPLAWSMLLAIMMLPMVKFWEKHIKHKSLSILLTLVIFGLIGGGVLALLSVQIYQLANDLPNLPDQLQSSIEPLRVFLDEQLGFPYEEQPDEIIQRLSGLLQQGLGNITGTLNSMFQTITLLFIIPIYVFFILFYRHKVYGFIQRFYKKDESQELVEAVKASIVMVKKYLIGLLMDTLAVAVLAAVVFYSLGIKYALFFSLFVALLNLIPFVGVFIGSSVSVLYAFATTEHLFYPLAVMILLWIIQLVENNIIKPYIMGGAIELNPLIVLIVVLFGSLVWGVSGMILFIPMLGVLRVLLERTPQGKAYSYLLGEE